MIFAGRAKPAARRMATPSAAIVRWRDRWLREKFFLSDTRPGCIVCQVFGGIIMKIAHLAVVSVVILSASVGFAAPSESVESAGASTAYQKVDATLGEQMVACRLQAAGLSAQQVHARLSQLNDQQLGQLAAQADMIQAGGMIQNDDVNKLGPLGCMWHQITILATNIYRVLFCWTDLK